ncbi:hypothetical protein KR026_007763 [Drosophila bipectinata]|nr:hypothetical protein KR026_007763 [Drosophila bipectinata]
MAIQEDQEAVPDAPREEEVPNSEEGREEEAITEKYLVTRYTEYQETFPYTEREGDGPSISDFFATITESEREKIESFLRRIQSSQREEAVPDALSEEEAPNSDDDTDLIVIDLNEHRLHNRNPVTTPDANNAVSKLSDSDDKRNCPKNDDNFELLCGESSEERNCSKEADNLFCESSTCEVTEEEFSKKKNDDNSSNSSP